MNPRERAVHLVARDPDVTLGQLMGMLAIEAREKTIGGFRERAMVFTLPDPEGREAALDGARLFDPSDEDRPLREWVQGPAAHADEWPRLAEQALTHRAG